MGVYKLSANSVKNGRTIYGSMLAGNTAFLPTSFDSIATVTVGSGGAANVEFTSIPSTYSHLQIRTLVQTNRSTYTVDEFYLQVNGVTSANYSRHELLSSAMTNDTPYSQGSGSETKMANIPTISGVKANFFGAAIIDILDYANTNKYKTLRYLGGADSNGDTVGYHNTLGFGSGALYLNTNAITSIKMYPAVGSLFNQYSHFALYGIKSA